MLCPRLSGRNTGLLKVLGVWFGISAAIGNTIAVGIVRTSGDIAQLLPEPILFIGVWLLGGAYALCGASSMAELGAAIPLSGGQYNYSRRAISNYAGFIVGWSDWLSSCGALAVVAMVVAEYSAKLISFFSHNEKVTAIAILSLFTLMQCQGIRWGNGAQLFTAALKTLAFTVLIITAFAFGNHQLSTSTALQTVPQLKSGWPLIVSIMLGLQAVIYTMDGWDGAIYFGEETRDPGKTIPKAIFGSVFSILAIYLMINLAVLYVLPMGEICGNKFVLGTLSERLFGQSGDLVIRTIMIISLLSCINAIQLFCSRVLYAMSCEGLFWPQLSGVNKGGTPVVALLLSTAVSIIFVMGSFQRVIAMLSFFFVANYTLTYLSLFLLRKNEPDMERPYKAWGYPWTTGIALGGSIIFLAASLLTDRENAPLALLALILSYPFFRLVSVRSAQ